MISRLFALSMVIGTPVAAQQVVFSTAAVDQCLATGQTETCVGRSSDACEAASPFGGTTAGMIDCMSRETAYWDGALNYYYQELRQRGGLPAEKLRDMQRNWISFRDSACAFEASLYEGGTMAGIVHSSCLLSQTGRQTLYLKSYYEDWDY